MKVYIGDSSKIIETFDNDISCFDVDVRNEDSRAALILLKYIIKKDYDVQNFHIKYNKFGKPYIDGIYYNISHSKGKIVVAIGNENVGIDIQKNVETIQNVKKKFFNKEDYVSNLLYAWVIKESYLKFLGIGLKNDLFDIRIRKEVVEYEDYEKAYYQYFDLKNGYALAISAKNKDIIELIYV